MARKKNNITETESDVTSPDTVERSNPEVPQDAASSREPEKPVAPNTASPVQKAPAPPKKRIRIRPTQKKKLSVAVLCTNPLTRRFI